MKRLMAFLLVLGFLGIWIAGCAGTSSRGMGYQPGYEPGVSAPIDLKHWTP